MASFDGLNYRDLRQRRRQILSQTNTSVLKVENKDNFERQTKIIRLGVLKLIHSNKNPQAGLIPTHAVFLYSLLVSNAIYQGV